MTPSDLIKLSGIEELLRDAGHTKVTVDFETWRKLILAAWKGIGSSNPQFKTNR